MSEPRVRLVFEVGRAELEHLIAEFNARVKAQLPSDPPLKLPPPLDLDE